jgi:hypothetical protein
MKGKYITTQIILSMFVQWSKASEACSLNVNHKIYIAVTFKAQNRLR